MTAIFAPIRMIEDQLAALVARNGIFCQRSGRTDPVGGDAKERGAVAHAGAGGGLSRSIRRRMSANRSRGMATSAPAQGQPRGARSGAGRIRALGVGRWAQARGADSAARGRGRALCWRPTRDEAGKRLKSGNVASEGAVPRDRNRPWPYQLACMRSITPCSAVSSLAGSRRAPSKLRSNAGAISKRIPIR